jgi:hypothetical protein
MASLRVQFNSQVRERRIAISGSSFDYCYQLNPNQTEVLLPDVSLTTAGGAKFPVTMPVIVLGDEVTRRAVAYCLAMLKNDITTNIIGRKLRPPAMPLSMWSGLSVNDPPDDRSSMCVYMQRTS